MPHPRRFLPHPPSLRIPRYVLFRSREYKHRYLCERLYIWHVGDPGLFYMSLNSLEAPSLYGLTSLQTFIYFRSARISKDIVSKRLVASSFLTLLRTDPQCFTLNVHLRCWVYGEPHEHRATAIGLT